MLYPSILVEDVVCMSDLSSTVLSIKPHVISGFVWGAGTVPFHGRNTQSKSLHQEPLLQATAWIHLPLCEKQWCRQRSRYPASLMLTRPCGNGDGPLGQDQNIWYYIWRNMDSSDPSIHWRKAQFYFLPWTLHQCLGKESHFRLGMSRSSLHEGLLSWLETGLFPSCIYPISCYRNDSKCVRDAHILFFSMQWCIRPSEIWDSISWCSVTWSMFYLWSKMQCM